MTRTTDALRKSFATRSTSLLLDLIDVADAEIERYRAKGPRANAVLSAEDASAFEAQKVVRHALIEEVEARVDVDAAMDAWALDENETRTYAQALRAAVEEVSA